MTRRISLSRAARLVGVKRGVLQRQIRAGELNTFEGQIILADLLQAYPDAQIEDSSMLERVEQIIEQASFINADERAPKADNQALAARVMALGKDLSRHKHLLSRYRNLLSELRAELGNDDVSDKIATWLDRSQAAVEAGDDTIDQPFINETFLRVMTAQATIIPSGHEFFVEGAESLLESGLRGGLALNYGCSNGNCGLCKLRLVSGDTRKIRHHDYSLTEAEKGIGYLLACCHTAVTDVVLEGDEAHGTDDIPQQNIALRLKRIEQPDPGVLIVSTRTPRTSRLRFLAGQRAQLTVDHVGSSLYPIASCPCDDMNLQFHIAVDPTDPVAGYLADGAQNNDLLTLDGPNGAFVLNENSPRSLMFIAQGIGFASIKGLIEHAMALDSAEHIHLLWISDSEDPPYLHNLCRAWNDALDNFDYRQLPASALPDLVQQLDADLQDQDAQTFDYYLCGETELKDAFQRFAEQRQLASSQQLFEPTLTRD